MANLQYHFTDTVMGYLSYAKGFKSGGWTTRLTAPLPPGSPAQAFGPETDRTYELGLKSDLLDRRLIVNTAAFLSKYDQIQLTYEQSTSPVAQNAGNARIKGTEIETQSLWRNHFSVNASLGYQDARYTEINQYAQATTGRCLPKTPKLKVSINPDVHTVLGNGATLRLGFDYTHTGEIYNDVEDDPLLRRPKEDLFDGSAGVILPIGKVTVTVGGTNLTNRRFITTGRYNGAGGTICARTTPRASGTRPSPRNTDTGTEHSSGST